MSKAKAAETDESSPSHDEEGTQNALTIAGTKRSRTTLSEPSLSSSTTSPSEVLPLTNKPKRTIDTDLTPGTMVRDGDAFFYILDPSQLEKEPTVYEQTVGDCKAYSESTTPLASPELTEKSIEVGRKVFLPYAKGDSVPEKPSTSQGPRLGFHVQSPNVLAFRGRGGKDLSSIWHMLVIPTASAGGYNVDTDSILLRWVFDLEPKHLSLVKEMKRAAIRFVQLNNTFFLERFRDQGDIAGKPLSFWLQPDNIQFGFHSIPSVGYLHMHALIGPLTDFGASEYYRSRWVDHATVISCLETGKPLRHLQDKP